MSEQLSLNKPVADHLRTALVVVDMQPDFKGSEDPQVAENVESLIKRFYQERKHIFFLEYMNAGPTSERFLDHLRFFNDVYDKMWVARKADDDGSYQVIQLIEGMRLPIDTLVVCGVNASFCVYLTVLGFIRRQGYTVIVPEEATTNAPHQLEENPSYGPRGLARLERFALNEPRCQIHPMMEVMAATNITDVINM